MKKLIILSLFVSTIAVTASAQSMGSTYKTAIGLKVYPGAFTIKHFINKGAAIEGLAYLYNYGFRATGLYEFHFDINGAPGLKWYVGPGFHVGAWNDHWKKDYPTRESSAQFGVDGVIGLDYKFNGVPINLSFDWQPSLNLVGYNYFEAGWGGLGVRYTF